MSHQEEIDKAIKDKRLYFVGERLPSDWYEAFRLWLPLAEAGDPKAQFNIGRCYATGDGADKESSKAIEWYMKAAAQGEPRAHFNLYLEHSEKENKNDGKAAEWLAKAVELGEPRALKQIENNSLNELKETAKNSLIAGDKGKARELYKQLVDKGDDDAKLGLTACDVELSIEQTTTTGHASYTASVTSTAGYVKGGGTNTVEYKSHTIVFKLKNRSPNPATASIWIEEYDHINPEKKIKNAERLDFPTLQPGEVGEVRKDLHKVLGREENPTRVFLTGFTIWRNKTHDPQYLTFPCHPKVLAWEWKKLQTQEQAPIEKKNGCFVMTACYGDYDAPTVLAFRQFRDNHLNKSKLGRGFIEWYYTHGPKMANFISDMPRTKAVLRSVFNQLAKIIPR